MKCADDCGACYRCCKDDPFSPCYEADTTREGRDQARRAVAKAVTEAKTKAYEEELEEAPAEALSGSATTLPNGGDDASQLLLDLITNSARLAILLVELDEHEWRAVAGRLAAFKDLVAGLSESPRPSRRVGFQIRKKAKRKAKGLGGKK